MDIDWQLLNRVQFTEADQVRAITLQHNLNKVVMKHRKEAVHEHTFNCKVKDFVATNQENSGRCWIFAGLNLMRSCMARKYHLPDTFELSQPFVFFFDRLEKSNLFLQLVIDTSHLDLLCRRVTAIFNEPVSDGGHWNMFVALVEKYGIVAKTDYGESWSSSNSYQMNYILDNVLITTAHKMRACESVERKYQLKSICMIRVYRLLCNCMGNPPRRIRAKLFPKRQNDSVPCELNPQSKCVSSEGVILHLSPELFYKRVCSVDLRRFKLLVDDPRFEPNTFYSVEYQENVVGFKSSHLTVGMPVIFRLIVESLIRDVPVWFSCDMSRFVNHTSGTMDLNEWTYDKAVQVNMSELNKADRIKTRISGPSHAMLITGCNVEGGHVTRFRIENSWGKESANCGFFSATSQWLIENAFHFVFHDKVLALLGMLSAFERPKIVLPYYDPMGMVA